MAARKGGVVAHLLLPCLVARYRPAHWAPNRISTNCEILTDLNKKGAEVAGTLTENMVVNDPTAMREAACLGLVVALIATVDVLPELKRGDLIRLLPDWYTDAGAISLYYASRTLISAKTRVFVDFVINAFKSNRLDAAFSANRRERSLSATGP